MGGDRAENLEKAIAAYEAALTVRTREASPPDWALTQYNLGAAYSDRMGGDRAEVAGPEGTTSPCFTCRI